MATRSLFTRIAARRLIAPAQSVRAFHPAIVRKDAAAGDGVGAPHADLTDKMVEAHEVPVTNYSAGERTTFELPVQPVQESQPVTPPGTDTKKVAFGLNSEIIKQLTPTMKKFTLEGKVAVITG